MTSTLCACHEADSAAVIEVQSDFAGEVTQVEVEVRDAEDRASGDKYTFATPKFELPFSFRVVREEGKAQFVVRATAYQQDVFLAQAKLRVALKDSETSHHDLWLLDACRDVRCEDGASCDPERASCGEIPRSSVAARRDPAEAHADAGDGGAAGMDAGPAADSGGAGAGGAGGSHRGAGGSGGGGSGGAPAAEGGEKRSAGSSGAGGRERDAGSGSGSGASGAGAGGAAGAPAAAGSGGAAAGAPAAAGNGGAAAGSPAAGSGGSNPTSAGSNVLDERDEYAHVTFQDRDYIVEPYFYGTDGNVTINYDPTSTAFDVTAVVGQSSAGLAMPSVHIGSLWYRATHNSGLPKQVSTIQAIDVTFDHNAGSVPGSYNASHSMAFGLDADPDTGTPTGSYIDVCYFISPDALPAGSVTARQITIPGVPGKWDLWQGSCGETPCASYVRSAALSSFEGDLKPFLDDALQREGLLQPGWYMTRVLTGFDIRAGGVGLHAENISTIVR